MYVGHAALALFAKSRRPHLPIALLVVVAYAPDWIEWVLAATHGGSGDFALDSHSIPSVVIGSIIVGLGALAWRRPAADAAALSLLYLSHWAVDFITGLKPTWPGGPIVGLHLYSHPLWDFLLESALVIACWAAYRRSLPGWSRGRVAWLIPAGLIALQAGFAMVLRTL